MSRWFEAPLSTLAFCWRIARGDGVTIGLTSHDRDLRWGGVTYQAAPGMAPSAIERSAGMDPDSVQLTGALTTDLLTGDDLTAGRWDGARLTLWAVDWTNPANDPVQLSRGQLGAVEMSQGQFSVELDGPGRLFDAAVTEAVTPHCRASLGDERCRVDLAGRVVIAQVVALSGSEVTVDRPLAPGDFAYGSLLWAKGPRAGLRDAILANDALGLTLAEAPDIEIAGPIQVELSQGCDRRFATCRDRFGNAANFRGEPHLPGNDLLLRYG